MRYRLVAIIVSLASAFSTPAFAQESPRKATFPELDAAKLAGWQLASMVLDALEKGDNSKWPGIAAWLADFRKATKGVDLKTPPEKWPAFDIDALATRNPKFWDAYYEIAPGDPGAILLHAGLLLAAGECDRAASVVVIGGQRSGVPQEILTAFDMLLGPAHAVKKKANLLVGEGIALHDRGDFDGALKKYETALKMWSANGFAYYERGLTQRENDWKKSTKKEAEFSKRVVESFASARRHDPWQLSAYQGSDPQVIAGFIALGKKGHPAWQKVLETRPDLVKDKILIDLGDALQEAQQHELALVTRQVIAARKGRFVAEDHPFIKASLKKLAPGEATDSVITRLAGERLSLRQIVKPQEP